MRQLCYQELPAAYFPRVLIPFISLSLSHALCFCSIHSLPTLSLWLQSQRICPFIVVQSVHHFKWRSVRRRHTYFYTTWCLSLRVWQAKQIQAFLLSNPKPLRWNSQTVTVCVKQPLCHSHWDEWTYIKTLISVCVCVCLLNKAIISVMPDHLCSGKLEIWNQHKTKGKNVGTLRQGYEASNKGDI